MKLTSNEEDQMWEHMLFSQGTDDDFTEKVMQRLEGIEMNYSKQSSHRRFNQSKQRRRLITAAAAVSLIVIGSSLLAWKQPHLMLSVASIFSPQPQTVEETLPPELEAWKEMSDISWLEDYKNSKPLGLVQTPKLKVEDKGYSFEIVNVMVDGSRIVIIAKQTGPDGNELQSPLEDGGIEVTDLEGNVIASLARGINMMDGLDEYVFIFDKTVPDQILVTGYPEYISVSVDNPETGRFERQHVEVNWDFELQVDMTKAKQYEHRDILNAEYTTPDGLAMSMEQMIRTPNGIRLDMSFKLEDDLASKATADWGDDLHIWYHLETDHSQDMLFGDGIGRHSVKIQRLSKINEENGTLPWSEIWHTGNVPPETKKLRFVLDGYSLPVKEEATVHIPIEKLEQTPVVFEHEGDQFTILGASIENVAESSEHVLLLHAKGLYTNKVTRDQWIAMDSDGKEYSVNIKGIGSGNENGTAAWDMDFVVEGVDQNMSELTLKRVVVDKTFTEVNWSVDLPSYTSLPWVNHVGE